VIAIDLGSNTIRFIEYDGVGWGKSFEKIVKTAEALYQTHQIGDPAVQRIIEAIREAQKKFDFTLHDVVGVTTAAMRLATNAGSVLEAIYDATGIRFTVIDAADEAKWTLRAVQYRLHNLEIEPSSFILADIGGGSTELIRFEKGKVKAVSLNIGIVTMSESSDTTELLEEKIHSFRNEIRRNITPPANFSLVLTAGTPTTIAAYLLGMDYASYDPGRINGFRLSLVDCFRVYDELLQMDEHTRTRYVGIGRERLIVAGILMVTSIYSALGIDDAIVVDDGLREGVALAYFDHQAL